MCSTSRNKLLFNWVSACYWCPEWRNMRDIVPVCHQHSLVRAWDQSDSIGNACNEDMLSLHCHPLQTFFEFHHSLVLTKPSPSYCICLYWQMLIVDKHVIKNLTMICMKMIYFSNENYFCQECFHIWVRRGIWWNLWDANQGAFVPIGETCPLIPKYKLGGGRRVVVSLYQINHPIRPI